MHILDSPTKSLEIVLAGTVATTSLPWTVAAIDVLDNDKSVSAIINTNGVVTGATVVTMLTGPASGHTRQIKTITVYNVDTTGATITARINDNGTTRILWKVLADSLDNVRDDD